MSSPAGFLLLLLASHLLGDFVLQSRRTAKSKRRFSVLMRHGGEMLAAHGVVLWPFWSAHLWVGLVALVAAHLVVDAVKARRKPTLAGFTMDQILHVGALVVLWRSMGGVGFTELGERWLPLAGEGWYVWLMLFGGLVGFALHGGGVIVRLVLGPSLEGEAGPEPSRGATIGYLERGLLLLLGVMGQWASIGLILAAKSLARFRELDQRAFAEYYLIGTLTSVLVAVSAGIVATLALGWCGVALP